MDVDQRVHEPFLSRRRLLGIAGSSWLAIQSPLLMATGQSAAQAKSLSQPFIRLEPMTAAGLEAITARIIPTDETPGAREIGVIHFIDQALATFLASSEPLLLQGLAQLDEKASSGELTTSFAALGTSEQDALLTEIEDSAFFQLMHYLTVAGMFAMPSYGGNREQLGWQLIEFEQRHAWSPPFGHYDAQASATMSLSADQRGHEHD